MFMKIYDEAIKSEKTENEIVDTVVKAVNDAATKLQAAKQIPMQLWSRIPIINDYSTWKMM